MWAMFRDGMEARKLLKEKRIGRTSLIEENQARDLGNYV